MWCVCVREPTSRACTTHRRFPPLQGSQDPAASVIRALPLNVMTTFEESIASPRHIVLPPVGHTRHGFLIFTLTPDSDSSCWLDGRQWCVTVAFGGDEARKRIRLFDVDYSLHRVVPGIADFSWGRHHVL